MIRTHLLASLFAFGVFTGPVFSADPAPTRAALIESAGRGDAEAQFQLSRALLADGGGDAVKALALDWMKKAAAQGHADALGGVGYFFANGVAVPKDEAQAVEWFRKGADKGSAKSQLNLGLLTANGRGVAKDEAEGLRLIDAAAAKAHREALYAQAETYFYGQFGRTLDYSKALPIFQKAAEAGHVGAQINLGVIFRDGLGTKKDDAAAISWFRRAAEQGNAKAQSNLGHIIGIETSDRARRLEGLKWIILAAEQREVTAMKTLEELQHRFAAKGMEERAAEVAEARSMAEAEQEKLRAQPR